MHQTMRILLQFIKRDWYAQHKHLATYAINYTIINAVVYAFSFCYLQGVSFFGAGNSRAATAMFVGSASLTLFVTSYKMLVPLLFDLEHDRFVEYQIGILSPRLLLLERIFFTACLTFVFSLPFFPLAKLIVGSYLNTQNTSWLSVVLILAAASLMCSAYNMFTLCALKGSYQLTQLWARCNIPLLILAGWVPWTIMKQFSVTFGYAALINPMLYVTEGLRQAFLGSNQYLPLIACFGMLLIFTVLFTLLAWHYFKQRTDHV